ncbi:MAG: hypothetical protein NVS3B28_20790 [Candidatus Velthaea sp.]
MKQQDGQSCFTESFLMEQFAGEKHGWGLDEYETGLLLGLLIGDGHFGGDRKQPHITIKMHVRHEPLLRHLADRCPGGKLYGPYNHDNRNYYQLMFRGSGLRYGLVPLLDRLPWANIDPHSHARYTAMKTKYRLP